jgi:hypothetical protein
MVFLIEYARDEGRLITFKKFADESLSAAQRARLDLELDLNRRGVEHEVVILEAENEQALRRTHRRYFENLTELVNAF